MTLKTFPASTNLRGKRVLLRLDWNVPLTGGLLPEESLKIERSLQTIQALQKRGAIVIVLTHLGRPVGRDPRYSTQHLLPLLAAHYDLHPTWESVRISDVKERTLLIEALSEASPGSLVLLENVRFEAGEEKNAPPLAAAYAELGDLFINDAFASSHRAHASVAGIAKCLPSYAGPELVKEVTALSALLKPKKPFVVIVGGFKVSTKLPVLKALLPSCDAMLIGGAMAATVAKARKFPVGKTPVEPIAAVKQLASSKKVFLPEDVMVTRSLRGAVKPVARAAKEVHADDLIVDVGPKTLRLWAEKMRTARMLLWNGPVGVIEIASCGAGSRFIARTMARIAKGKAFGVAGGGDTLPAIVATNTTHWFDHVSMGGGAMLDFLAKKGKVPGILPLLKK